MRARFVHVAEGLTALAARISETTLAEVAKRIQAEPESPIFETPRVKPEPYVNDHYAAAIARRVDELGHVDKLPGYAYVDGQPILTPEEMRQHLFIWFGTDLDIHLCRAVLRHLAAA